jgi:hypothetical protein
LSDQEEWSTTEVVTDLPLARRNFLARLAFAGLIAIGLLFSGASAAQSGSASGSASAPQSGGAQDAKTDDPSTTRLKIVVTNYDSKPVGSASVYVRFGQAGGFLHKDKLAEMAFKTNDDGSVKVPDVPVGRVLIQVVGKGLHTYGKWYDIVKDQDTIEIKLERPPHWY